MRNLVVTLGCLVLSSTCLAQAGTWIQATPKNSPSARWLHGTAYDLFRGRTVIFGGVGIAAHMADTWEYDGTNWTLAQPQKSPPARTLTTMAFYLPRGTTVLFGGSANSNGYGSNLGDTWTWDGKNWTQMTPKNSPSPRSGAGMAYDWSRGRIVLFGGEYVSPSRVFYNDTWEWDGVNWTQIKTANSPPARYSMGLAYDQARKRIVLFGGYNNASMQDTWEYDGKNWTQIKPATQPSPRCCFGFAYHTDRQRTMMFGGWSGFLQETWEYDGKTWTQIKPKNQPPGRYDFDQMVYDPRRKRLVLFGGRGATSARLADTWEHVGPQPLTASPPTISIASGGTHSFTLDAGAQQGNRLYWIFGSLSGTSPGVVLASAAGSVTIPLNPDLYTNITIAQPNTALLVKTKGTLDASGKGQASLVVPKITDQNAIGVIFYHAYLVYDASNNYYMASNATTLQLVK